MMAGPDRPSMVIVCTGIDIERYSNKSAFAWLREEHSRGVAIGGLCTGAHVLAAAGLLSGKRCAIHWENLPGFAEAGPMRMCLPTCLRSIMTSTHAPAARPLST